MVQLLTPRTSAGAVVEEAPCGLTRLRIPAGPTGKYRLAQLDDARGRHRRDFPWRPPVTFSLEARADEGDMPGTWGFGLWNVPLSMAVGFGSSAVLPALPDAAWFFHASPRCHLSFRNDLPGHGFLAQTFRSALLPTWALAPAAVFLPLLAIRPVSRMLRRAASRWLVSESGAAMDDLNPMNWHHYRIVWTREQVVFQVDERTVLQTSVSPHPPLSLVIWVDNQFAAWTPAGELKYGLEENDRPALLEIRNLDFGSP